MWRAAWCSQQYGVGSSVVFAAMWCGQQRGVCGNVVWAAAWDTGVPELYLEIGFIYFLKGKPAFVVAPIWSGVLKRSLVDYRPTKG